jgi:hypothetical protein
LIKTTKVKEKVKADKDRIGITYSSKIEESLVDMGNGRHKDNINGKIYREVNINTSDYLEVGCRKRY